MGTGARLIPSHPFGGTEVSPLPSRHTIAGAFWLLKMLTRIGRQLTSPRWWTTLDWEWNGTMDSELSDACLKAIQIATKPVSLSEIGAACGQSKPNDALVKVLKQLAGKTAIHQWPTYRTSQMFASRPLRGAVEEAFALVLDESPMTIAKAAKPVSKILGRVSEASALTELRVAAPKLAAAGKIIQVPVTRQSVVYMSFSYLGRIVPAKQVASAIEKLIVDVVMKLQPGPGNYVRVDQLRWSAELRRFFDASVIALADQGKLVLAPYGGARPQAAEDRLHYVEDAAGHLFVGVALPRNE